MPLPVAPTCRMSRANTGRSAVAPPKSTAIRSSEIAPRSGRLRKIRRTPSSTSASRGSCSPTCATPIRRGTSGRSAAAAGGERRCEQIRRRRADRLGDAAHGGPDHHRGLARRGDERERLRQVGGVDAGGEQGAEGGAGERISDAPAEGEHVQRPDGRVARGGVERERDGDRGRRHQPRTGDHAPVVAVDHVAGRERQQHGRDELGQPEQAEHERVAAGGCRPASRARSRSPRARGSRAPRRAP